MMARLITLIERMMKNNILYHISKDNDLFTFCATRLVDAKSYDEVVLGSGTYDPTFGDFHFQFSFDGKKLPLASKLVILVNFAKFTFS